MRSGRGLFVSYALAVFLSAFLLFVIQPLLARAVLPMFGGSAAVWTTAASFFQLILLAAYAYAHVGTRWLPARIQFLGHALLLGASLALLPVNPTPSAGSGPPALALLGFLARRVGLPALVIAATAPLLQRWFSLSAHRRASNPAVLYVASNLGSTLALVLYPLLIEPKWSLRAQARFWSAGFGALAVVTLLCGSMIGFRSSASALPRPSPPAPTWTDFGIWAGLACVPSSLMLGVTAFITTDIAAVPLFWVVPLGLYLLSYALVFTRPAGNPGDPAWARILPLLVLALTPSLAVGLVQLYWIPVHLVAFFVAVMVCHGELAARRPAAEHLTGFYLAIAAGGGLGGLFNTLVAPLLFDRPAEYPLMLIAACLIAAWSSSTARCRFSRNDLILTLTLFALVLLVSRNTAGLAETVFGVFAVMLASGLGAWIVWTLRTHSTRFALALGAVWLACGLAPGVEGWPLWRDRTFYGSLRVTQDDRSQVRRLFLGSTLHGEQSLDPARCCEPTTYFTRTGPFGAVFESLAGRQRRADVAVIGLGVGTLACYAQPDQRWTFFELDPQVVWLARASGFFAYLDHCKAGIPPRIVIGDARLRLAELPQNAFHLIVLDAFSSDAVPVHLLTREALELYRSRLARGGLIVFNLSNRYLDLAPAIGALARDAGMACLVGRDLDVTRSERRQGKQPSIWAVLANADADLGELARDPRWSRPPSGRQVWTDDHVDLIACLRRSPL